MLRTRLRSPPAWPTPRLREWSLRPHRSASPGSSSSALASTRRRMALSPSDREAGHGKHRIVHANGDATGAELMRTLRTAVRRRPDITIMEHTWVVDLVRSGDRVAGVYVIDGDGDRRVLTAPAVVLATGGIGRVYAATTNPVEVTGDGLAMAARAGPASPTRSSCSSTHGAAVDARSRCRCSPRRCVGQGPTSSTTPAIGSCSTSTPTLSWRHATWLPAPTGDVSTPAAMSTSMPPTSGEDFPYRVPHGVCECARCRDRSPSRVVAGISGGSLSHGRYRRGCGRSGFVARSVCVRGDGSDGSPWRQPAREQLFARGARVRRQGGCGHPRRWWRSAPRRHRWRSR